MAAGLTPRHAFGGVVTASPRAGRTYSKDRPAGVCGWCWPPLISTTTRLKNLRALCQCCHLRHDLPRPRRWPTLSNQREGWLNRLGYGGLLNCPGADICTIRPRGDRLVHSLEVMEVIRSAMAMRRVPGVAPAIDLAV